MNPTPFARLFFAAAIIFFASHTPANGAGIEPVLEHLHQGRFQAAEQAAERLPGESAGDRAVRSFLLAFAGYWQALYDPENRSTRRMFEDRLLQAIRDGERYLSGSPSDARAALFLGSAHLLRAQLRAAEKKVLPAAYEAKKSRRMLLQALHASGAGPDSCFGLGTYEYYADMLPAVVKGLRFLLFIPGGDREVGLQRLERAASQGSLFRFEARVVLLGIYSGGKERLYDDALRHGALLLEEQDRSVTALHAVARLNLSLARPGRATDLLDEALDRAGRDTAPEVLAALHYNAARARYQQFLPDSAGKHLEWLLQGGRKLPEGMAAAARDLAARNRLLQLAGDGSALKRMMDGRARLVRGDAGEAARILAEAASAPGLPAEFTRRSRLLAGQAADLAGRRNAALRWYREAGNEDAASLYLRRPFTLADGF